MFITGGSRELGRNADFRTFGTSVVETPQVSGDSIVYLVSQKADWLGGRYVNCLWDLPQLLTMKEGIVTRDKLNPRFIY